MKFRAFLPVCANKDNIFLLSCSKLIKKKLFYLMIDVFNTHKKKEKKTHKRTHDSHPTWWLAACTYPSK